MSYNNTKMGTNLEDVQEMNRSLIIRLIRKLQICSRAELAKETGLTQPTITNIVSDLIKWGLVQETGLIDGKRGRRSIGITLMPQSFMVIGVRLTRKYIAVGLFGLDGTEVLNKVQSINTEDGAVSALNTMKQMISEVLQSVERNSVVAIGVADPRYKIWRRDVRPQDGVPMSLLTDFPGWEKISIQHELQQTFDMAVYVEHDAKVGALAEWWFGSHNKDIGTMLYVSVAQGVGAGLVIDGNIYHGAHGIAGEIGHMSIDYTGPDCACGNKGCLELYCSFTSLLKKLHHRYTPQALWEALEQGEPAVVAEVEQAAWFLGFGLASAVNTLNPHCIIIGDEMARAGDVLMNKVKEVLKAHLLPEVYENLIVEFSSFSDSDPILVGASALAIDHILRSPSAFLSMTK